MSTVIDHAIAIPTTSKIIWEQISDLRNNPHWQSNCESVTFLTTMHAGQGTRWRSRPKRGGETVLEIKAWYDSLGYEYTILDGAPYPNNRGRIRLQETPDGTIVQWTFSYEISGMWGGLRNSLRLKNRADQEIVESLRNLYTYIKERQPDAPFEAEEAKSYLREGPDALGRAQYQPRYPSKVGDDSGQIAIVEPPVADDDTRPNPNVQETAPEPAAQREPDFPQGLPNNREQRTAGEDDPYRLPLLDEAEVESTRTAPTEGHVPPDTSSQPIEPQRDAAPPEPPPAPPKPTSPPRLGEKLDTTEISVFEVFGLEKPSDTERIRLQTQSMPFANPEPIIPDIEPLERRQGLRAALRQRLAKVRLPK